MVLCNPLGPEAMSAHRAYRHFAERLAERGFGALRFDYDGTGDSAGSARDPGRVRAWLDSIHAATAEARARSGVSQVALFGVRFGATLAAAAASEQGGVEALIQWAPALSGRTYVRELRGYRMMKSAKVSAERPNDGSEEVAGYFFSKATLDDMTTLELFRGDACPARRALVLPRGERATDEARLVEHWKQQGGDARLGAAPGYAQMMREDPYETVVPMAALDSIIEWLGAEPYPPKRVEPSSSGPLATAVALAPTQGRLGVIERPLLFGEEGRLFGVLSEPDSAIRAGSSRERPAVILLNVGANSHVGPHRMNVHLARELASFGYLTFRFDVAGLGESRAAPGTRENRIYTMDSVADVRAAMSLLGQTRRASRFVLVGLCSGAYLAFHTTVADPRVVGQVLLSSFAFEWKEGDPVTPTERATFNSTRSYGRAILDRRVWARAIRGDVNVRGIAGILVERLRTHVVSQLPAWKARVRGRKPPQNAVERSFHALCDRGVESLLVFSFNDGGLDMVAKYLGKDARKIRRKQFELEIVDRADHTFTSIESQAVLSGAIRGYLQAHFA